MNINRMLVQPLMRFTFARSIRKLQLGLQLQAPTPSLKFYSIEGINRFIESNEVNDGSWRQILDSIHTFNRSSIIEQTHQQTFLKSLAQSVGKQERLDNLVIERICMIMVQYEKHKYSNEQTQSLRSLLCNQLYMPQLSLKNVLVISSMMPLDQQEWQSKINLVSEFMRQDIELEYDQVKEIYNIVDGCRSQGIQVPEYVVPRIEEQILRYSNTLSKTVLLKTFRNLSFTRGSYNTDTLNLLMKRAVKLVHEMEIKDIVLINDRLNQLRVTDVIWFSQVGQWIRKYLGVQGPQEVLSLVESLSNVIVTPSILLNAIDLFKLIEGHFIGILHSLSATHQLIVIKAHSILLECIYNQHLELDGFRKRGKKRIEALNIRYYEIAMPQLKELDFLQTLQFLEYASVLGISKRKICQQIMEVGVQGLMKYNYTLNDQSSYILLNYYRLLKLLITNEQEIIKIEQLFNDIEVDTLELITNYGHLAIKRDKIESIRF